MNTAYFTNHQQQRFVYCLTLLLHPGGGGGGGVVGGGNFILLLLMLFNFLCNHLCCYDAESFWLLLLPINNVVAKLYGKGGNKFKIMIFLSRLPDKILLFFGSVNIM